MNQTRLSMAIRVKRLQTHGPVPGVCAGFMPSNDGPGRRGPGPGCAAVRSPLACGAHPGTSSPYIYRSGETLELEAFSLSYIALLNNHPLPVSALSSRGQRYLDSFLDQYTKVVFRAKPL